MGGRKLQGMLIVTVGLPASGKTSWVKGFIEDNKDKTIDIISSDKIREEMFNDIEDQNHNGEVFDLMKRRTKESLSQGHVVVYEATNISSKRRRALLKELKRYYDKAICLFKYKNVVDCDIDNCIREKKVPNDVIERMYKNFEIPHKNEGFDEIIIDWDYKFNRFLGNKSRTSIGITKDRFIQNMNYTEYIELLYELGQGYCVEMPQDSKWHTLSLSKHMYFCYKKIKENSNDTNLIIASMLHDIGKPIVKTIDKEGRYSHYYNHENVSAYDVIGILARYTKLDIEDILEIAWLIGNHMKLKKNIDKDKFSSIIGYNDYLRLEALDNADNSAK